MKSLLGIISVFLIFQKFAYDLTSDIYQNMFWVHLRILCILMLLDELFCGGLLDPVDLYCSPGTVFPY
jgi:hypothetical protein